MYVIDASALAPLIVVCGGNLVRSLKKNDFAVLDLTVYEVCNAFWKMCRKLRRIDEAEAAYACAASRHLARFVKLYRVTDLDVEKTMEIAVENNITFYDSSYIALASELNAPIASEDKDILTVAPKYGIKVVRLPELIKSLEPC